MNSMKMKRQAEIVAIVNQKGGVGKTTTAFNRGFGLTEKDTKSCWSILTVSRAGKVKKKRTEH